MEKSLDSNYWNNRYLLHDIGWDIGGPSMPIKLYIDQLEDKNISILIPGCGNAYEAEYLLQQGFTNVTVVDVSPVIVDALKEKLAPFVDKELTIICGNFFDLKHHYDLIIEQTFFCALLPALREKYAEKMFRILKQGGKLTGLLFNRAFEGGPPFGGNKAEYKILFSPYFEILVLEDCYNSIPPRMGNELFINLRKK